MTGYGPEFNNDLRMYYAQLGANLFPGDDYKLTLGTSVFHYYKDELGVPTRARQRRTRAHANGNNSTQFQLYEGFGQLDILGLPLPLSLYGQYVQNPNANGPRVDEGQRLSGRFHDAHLGDRRELQLSRRRTQCGRRCVHRFRLRVGLHRIARQQAAAVVQHHQELPVPDDVFLHRVGRIEPAGSRARTNTLQVDLVATF